MLAGAIDRATSTHHAVSTDRDDHRDEGAQHAFGDQLSRDAAAAGAERQANRNFPRARDTPRDGQAGDVGADQQQQAKHRGKDEEQLQAARARDFIRKRNEPNTPTGVRVWMLGRHSAGQRLHARRGPFDGQPGFHPADDAQEPGVARGAVRKTRAAVRRAHIPRRPKRRLRVGHDEVCGHHANHAPVAAFHVDGPIDDLPIGAQGLPQAMTQHDDRFAARRLPRRDRRRAFVFVRLERAPKHGLTTIDVEETARDMHAPDRRAAVLSTQGGRDRQHGGDRVERVIPGDPVGDIARGRAFAKAILGDIRLEHHDESIGLIVRQRPQQHRVNKREERGRGRDAKSEEERDAERHARRSHHRPHAPGRHHAARRRRRDPRASAHHVVANGDAAARARRVEQSFAVFADGAPIDRHARAAFRNARLARA